MPGGHHLLLGAAWHQVDIARQLRAPGRYLDPRRFNRQSGLPDPPDAGQRHHRIASKPGGDLPEIHGSADKGRPPRRQPHRRPVPADITFTTGELAQDLPTSQPYRPTPGTKRPQKYLWQQHPVGFELAAPLQQGLRFPFGLGPPLPGGVLREPAPLQLGPCYPGRFPPAAGVDSPPFVAGAETRFEIAGRDPGEAEPPTVRFSGVADAQLRSNVREKLAVYGWGPGR